MSKALAALLGWKRTTILAWDGPLPQVGEFLMSARPRYAYRVAAIDPAPAGVRYVAKAWLERLAPAEVAADAIVHRWQWASRG